MRTNPLSLPPLSRRVAVMSLALLLVGIISETAEARGPVRKLLQARPKLIKRSRGNYSGGGYAAASIYSSPQQAAQAKVAMLANAGRGWHPGGGFGGGSHEGWGFSTVSAEAARRGTCYGWKCNSAAGSATMYSARAGGWYAINIWW